MNNEKIEKVSTTKRPYTLIEIPADAASRFKLRTQLRDRQEARRSRERESVNAARDLGVESRGARK